MTLTITVHDGELNVWTDDDDGEGALVQDALEGADDLLAQWDETPMVEDEISCTFSEGDAARALDCLASEWPGQVASARRNLGITA